jgi:hypothetical protein
LNESSTILISEPRNRLDNFKRVIFCLLLLIGIVVAAFFVFEKNIVSYIGPRLPTTYNKTIDYYFDLFRLGAYEFLWMAAILVLALLFYSKPSLLSGLTKMEAMMIDKQKQFLLIEITVIALVLFIIAFVVLQQFPNSSDEYVYLYQAKLLSKGKLWEQAHPIKESFAFNHIAVKNGISVGRFPVGWPLIISFFLALGLPAIVVNPVLALVTLFIFFKLAKKLYGAQVALWSLLIFSCSGFFLFNSASFFSHTACLLGTLIFVYCIHLYFDRDKIKYALLAGLALGFIMLIRNYTAVLLFIPFFILLLYNYGFRIFRLFIMIGLGALPCLLGFLWYNYAITGNPLLPVTVWGFQNEGLGFTNGHTALKGIEHILRRFLMFIYWCSPVFLVLYFIFLWEKIRNRKERMKVPEDYFFICFIIGYFFYYEIGGNQYGPRFYYEAFPFLILFILNGIFTKQKYFAKLFLYAAFIVMVIKLPFISYREHTIIDQHRDIYNLVKEKKISNAVVLIASGTSDIRPMPVGDLTRNDPSFTNKVLYAIYDEKHNASLMNYYPDRSFYIYMRQPGNVHGVLVKIR